jgi:hypothetical protein
MRQITQEVADAASECLNTKNGERLMAFLVKEFGLMDRSFLLDQHGKVSPINAAIRDGERGVVGLLFKLKQQETYSNEQETGS